MKKLLIFLVSLPLLLSGCLKEENDIFSEDSATRVAKVQQETNDILVSAENGWLMEYYPNSIQRYGGYVMFASFNEGNRVVFASELAAADQTAESLYSLGADAGPTLNFDTFNDLFHFWSDPNPDGKGFEGDSEFIILNHSKSAITLKGKKTGNECVLTPLPADKTWVEMMTAQIEAAKTIDGAPSYAAIFPDEEEPALLSKSNRTFSITILRGEKAENSMAPYICTPTGIKFNKPFEVKAGVFIQSMTYNVDTSALLDDGGSGIQIIQIIPPLNIMATSYNWYFKFSALSPWAQSRWNITKAAFEGHGEELYYAFMGEADGRPYGFYFKSAAGSSLYRGEFAYTAAPVAGTENQIRMRCNMTVTGDGLWYHNNAQLAQILNVVAYGATIRTFTLTADNEKNPSWIKFTEDASVGTANENYFTLYKTEVIFPYRQ